MPSAKSALMVITLKIISLFFVPCVILVYIRDALASLKCLQIIGFVRYVHPSDLLVLMFLVLFVMLKEEL